MIMFIDEHDGLRDTYRLGRKKAESCVARNRNRFCIPLPALGEVLYKGREQGKHSDERYIELNRLIDRGFFDITFLKESPDAFRMADDILTASRRMPDEERDHISPMDALIVSVAATDPDSTAFYTSDRKLTYNDSVCDIIDDYREDRGYAPFRIQDIGTMLR